MKYSNILAVDTASINTAVGCLKSGAVIGYPTEAVWGLGCDPCNEQAVMRLLALKSRPQEKGLILVAASIQQFDELLAPLSRTQRALLTSTWPGPTTWVVPDELNIIPVWIKGKFDTVAVRVSDHPCVQALCQAYGGPIVSTSLNPSGASPALSQTQARQYFLDQLGCFVAGSVGTQASPSKIISLVSGKIIR